MSWDGATLEQLESFIDSLVTVSWSKPGVRPLVEQMREEVQARRPALGEVVKVGDFFECSWGYDQTNVDFYEVVKVTRATVQVVPVGSVMLDESANITHVAPLSGTPKSHDPFLPVDKPSTKRPRVYRWDGAWQVSLNMSSYADAYLWDCKPVYETALGWGH